MMYALIPIIAGITTVIARIINSNLADKIGIMEGTLINYIVGLFFSIIFLFLSSDLFKFSYKTMGVVPFWAYLGGLVGVIVVAMSNFITPKISSFYQTLIVFIGQLFTGIAIDYFAVNSVSIGKILGGLLVVLGLTYNLVIDKRQDKSEISKA